MKSEHLGEKIKMLREARGWSQQTLADNSGLSRSHIASIEARNNTHPRADYLMKLAQVFDIPLKELYESVGYVSALKIDRHAPGPPTSPRLSTSIWAAPGRTGVTWRHILSAATV